MKTRFDTFDLVCSVAELQRLIGMRVNQIYDIDHKTYLIRLQRSEEKAVLLLESGNRIHTTAFEWPKNTAPSGFSMKMRKHLKNKRLEVLQQVGTDRILDLQFGSGEAAYHIILELYDRGNIVLTDHELTTLNILRPHTEADKIRFAVRQKYPLHIAHTTTMPETPIIHDRLSTAKPGDPLKKVLNPLVQFGSALINHVLLQSGFEFNCKIGKNFSLEKDFDRVMEALKLADEILSSARKSPSKGFIIQKKESKPLQEGNEDFMMTNIDFHPLLFNQYKNQHFKEFESFDSAVDEYFSRMEGQKLDLKALQQERDVMKKLENVRKDHDQRLVGLEKTQEIDKQKAELITRNQGLVDNAILAIQSALANQMSWPDIQTLLNEAQSRGDPVASAIKNLKLETNHISLNLSDPYDDSDEEELKPMIVDIDLAQSAFGNATRYYNMKRSAAKKQQKTIESQGKAFKSAERKTKQTLKEVQVIHSINKARKVYWFEKFFWFITSENYLVIGGRDQQQNELIVKRYLRPGDLYVHADLSGASSVVIKNPSGEVVPPKSLAEAGTMAVAYSIAWEAKVVAGAWWVHHDQVSKTAPTGEYLTTGSFMIRGKKNYLPPCQLVMGFGFLFRLEESSVERHKGERRVKTVEEDPLVVEEDKEIALEDSEDEQPLGDIKEENIEGSSEDERSVFPDTQIKLDLSGPNVKFIIDNKRPLDEQDDPQEVYLGDNIPVKVQSRRTSTQEKPARSLQEKAESGKQKETSGLKRGQKGRLKKMKERYKDQDEEDRKLLMEVLKPDGAAKEDKRKKNKNSQGQKLQQKKKGPGPPPGQPNPQNIDNDDEDVGPAPAVDMLDQLTGKPIDEDELLFAVPVIAPYGTLQSYKFKVKLMPGTGRRGKAAKTAISVFLRDKTITTREKDLLKAVKEETIARNIPGKVKISAPQIQKHKK
ncbi:nuclear export mediator factor NEMF homolog [Fopius arisanus]|uniref:Nuclear export mediator factor NEMF homolog n=2 Tax=Braconidae TaxID=7402 RepID=A0A9R1UAX0_9HYME|nr:PREDICTED: nuclear export mediator factor NEMF homolog [Fopius arisanus]XP_011315461.1 PREDICTED: nuclear export mediator factor NEMF homolog [Fopius arisanus]